MVSATSLPSSPAVSRTMRGKAENRASIRCMRVRVTVSRMSATVSDRRSSAASTSGSLSTSRSRRASSLRASTMSDMPLIIRSSRSTFSRTEREPTRGRCAACTDATGCASSASAAISRSSPVSSSASPPSIASTMSPIRSTIARTASTSAVSGVRRPSRTVASASSAAWLSRARRGRSRKPQLPFTVWTKRKIASNRARSAGSASHATISPDKASSVSRVSAMNSCSRSSMGPRAIVAWGHGG